MGGGGGLSAAAGAVLAAELCAPLLLLCGLCCWPDDASESSKSSSGKHPQKPKITQERGRRRSSDIFSRRAAAASTTSLHLPSTSGGSKQQPSAHRSHEEIPARRGSHLEVGCDHTDRYHSAPSVIDEIIHRRDWERSTKELYIPLKPEGGFSDADSDASSPAAPKAESESSSIECLERKPSIHCKKHYKNIKSSRNRTKKEAIQSDVKDTDEKDLNENETSKFYIEDVTEEHIKEDPNIEVSEKIVQSIYKAKDDKQSINESIKTKERPRGSHITCIDDVDRRDVAPWEGYKVKMIDMDMDLCVDEMDRSGAMHHDAVSRGSLVPGVSRGLIPPASVESVGWEGGACYLAEAGCLRSRTRALAGVGGGARGRGRHASDGDILAPTIRPESGAFSESDLELELEVAEERPPAYDELRSPRKETAI